MHISILCTLVYYAHWYIMHIGITVNPRDHAKGFIGGGGGGGGKRGQVKTAVIAPSYMKPCIQKWLVRTAQSN